MKIGLYGEFVGYRSRARIDLRMDGPTEEANEFKNSVSANVGTIPTIVGCILILVGMKKSFVGRIDWHP